MGKLAVLLKGAHEMGACIQLEASDIVASAPYQEHGEKTTFPDVRSSFTDGQQDNIIFSAGVADSLDGVALIIANKGTVGLPITPKGGDIYLWNPTTTADNLQGAEQ